MCVHLSARQAELEEGSYRLLIIRCVELEHDDASIQSLCTVLRHVAPLNVEILHSCKPQITSVVSCSSDMCTSFVRRSVRRLPSQTPLFNVPTFVRLTSSDISNTMTSWRETIVRRPPRERPSHDNCPLSLSQHVKILSNLSQNVF